MTLVHQVLNLTPWIWHQAAAIEIAITCAEKWFTKLLLSASRWIVRTHARIFKDAMQSSDQASRSSTSPDRCRISSQGATTPPRLNIDGQVSQNQQGPFAERRAYKDGSVASRNTSAGSDQSCHTQQQHRQQHAPWRPRTSGGFLLPDPSSAFGPRGTRDDSADIKGKVKVDDGDLVISKRALRNPQRLKPSLGSSPLAVEVLNAASATHSPGFGGNDGHHLLSIPSKESGSIRSSSGSQVVPDDSRKDGEPKGNHTPALGFDTDPAEIVNLALRLSESRRRNFSGGLLAPADGVGDRRVISGGSTSPGFHAVHAGGSLRQHLQQQRRISRNISPRSGVPKRRVHSPRSGLNVNPTSSPPPIPIPDFVQPPELPFNPSDATLSRAEKARLALELSYEYRRLLQYLPKLPTSKDRSANPHLELWNISGELGRSYNPLQYIRNRRVRLRERQSFDSEVEGWKDSERVRDWVDTVANNRELGVATVDDRFPLPSFESVSANSTTVNTLLAQNPTKPSPGNNSKQRRPRMDWSVTPWDLLADAYWLQHDGNTMLIEDASGHKVMPSTESYKLPSAKNSLDIDRITSSRAGSVDRQAAPSKPFRTNAHETARERGRLQEQEPPRQLVDGSRDRRGRWPRKLIRSRSSSNSSDPDHDDRSQQKRGRLRNQDDLDSTVLEKHMMTLLAQEKVNEDGILSQVLIQDKQVGNSITGSNEHRNQGKSKELTQVCEVEIPRQDSNHTSARSSLERPRSRHRAMSIDDLDATAPNSPTMPGFTPSIAINLSRPGSPHISPKRILPTFRPARSKERQAISENDFALSSPSTTDLSRQGTRESNSEDMSRRERYKSEMNGFLSPTTEGFSKMFRRPESSSKSSKEFNGPDSRFRGFFRGGRIAEIVGSEVGRVSDRLWRKDAGNQASHVASPASGYASDESDLGVDGLDSSPDVDLSRTTTNDDEKPTYFMSNLPSFQMTSAKEAQKEAQSAQSSAEDPITRQQLAQRQRGRSARFERLAPPKIDMRSISSSPSPPLTRTQTRNLVSSYDPFDSRQSSTSRSEGRVRDADRRLNAVLGIPGTIGRGAPPMTGLASLKNRRSRERPAFEGNRRWSMSNRSVSAVRGDVTKRDIARVRALLLSSGVKANEIARRAHDISTTSSPILQDLRETSGAPLPQVPQSQEHALAARIFTSHIDEDNKQLRDAAERFSNETIDQLHQQIKDVDEHITQRLTPLVRGSADEADVFSAQLTTTHTLEVKQLNDAVDAILRRRRRRLRWVRRLGYVVLEWTLLGIMWWVWLIVVIVRLIRGTLRGFVRGVRWVLWL